MPVFPVLAFFVLFSLIMYFGKKLPLSPREYEKKIREIDADERFQKSRQLSASERSVEEQRLREGAKVSGADVVIQLDKLRHLKDKGVFTEIEYAARKRKVLDELKGKVITDNLEDFLTQFIPLVENETLSAAEIAHLKAIALAVEAQEVTSQVPAASQPAQVQMVPCPGCGKPGHPKATVCGYCWSKFGPAT